eukprot:1450435-Pleurochrysis_carterae.AAC.1
MALITRSATMVRGCVHATTIRKRALKHGDAARSRAWGKLASMRLRKTSRFSLLKLIPCIIRTTAATRQRIRQRASDSQRGVGARGREGGERKGA